MLLPTAAAAILELPLTPSERRTKSRSLYGSHLYCSHFHRKFKFLDFHDKRQLLDQREKQHQQSAVINSVPLVDSAQSWVSSEEGSLLSSSSDDSSVVCSREVSRLCWDSWKVLCHESKNAWALRACNLNRRSIPGVLVSIPNEWGNAQFSKIAISSVELDWSRFVSSYKFAILHQKVGKHPSKSYCFGTERVMVRNQVIKTFKISKILTFTLFGSSFSKLCKSSIINRSNTKAIIHIASMREMRDIFTFAGECSAYIHNHETDYIHTCCGKVRLQVNDKFIAGYILDSDESNGTWTVKLLDNKEIIIKQVIYDHSSNKYIYLNEINSEGYKLVHYEPIRLNISVGNLVSRISLNKLCYHSSSMNIIENLCS